MQVERIGSEWNNKYIKKNKFRERSESYEENKTAFDRLMGGGDRRQNISEWVTKEALSEDSIGA